MKKALAKIIIIILIFTVALSLIPACFGQDYKLSYQLLDRPDGDTTYQLEVVIPQQLNEYFTSQNHRLSSSSDFAKFVTPYALKPIADRLWQIYDNEEDFANGVLMLVHQIPYEETTPGKYSTETMIAGKGDCDLFAFIAASILKAGGLQVALLYYEEQSHMNIGVNLANPPKNARSNYYYIQHENIKYYIAECTGGKWKEGWRVGECPSDYKKATSEVIPLGTSIQIDPGQVSASFDIMAPSTLVLQVAPTIISQNSNLTIYGQVNPELQSQNVTLYAKINNSPWEVIGSTLTRNDGSFTVNWQLDTVGLCTIQASWAGNEQYTGALSMTKTAVLIPPYLIYLIATATLGVGLATFAFFKTRRNKLKDQDNLQTVPEANTDYPDYSI
jgi:hypothetical protein